MRLELGYIPITDIQFPALCTQVLSLIVLAFTSKSSRAPKAEGVPYDKGQR